MSDIIASLRWKIGSGEKPLDKAFVKRLLSY